MLALKCLRPWFLLGGVFCASVAHRYGFAADQMSLDVTPVYSVLREGASQMTWLRVGIEGFSLQSAKQRPPVNLALVLDKSSSMQGEKIKQAIDGAIDSIGLLNANDIVSVITYDTTVNVLVPATKLTDPEAVIHAIRQIKANGNTALFAGVSKGAAEVRKFLSKERVNRVILLSDGMANVGPSSPGELGALGATMLKENISVSSLGLGLGYNEDLMVELAAKSGGNHHFIEKATELASVFRLEFDDVLSVVAQEVDVHITVPVGIRPVRVLGNEASINGQHVVMRLAQVYSRQKKHVVLEVEIPAKEVGQKLQLATASVEYANMKTQSRDRLSGKAEIRISASQSEVDQSLDKNALVDVVALVSSEQSKLATKFLDNGDFAKCRATLADNGAFIAKNALLSPKDERLLSLGEKNTTQEVQVKDVNSISAPAANSYRKLQRADSYELDSQMRSRSTIESVEKSSSPSNR